LGDFRTWYDFFSYLKTRVDRRMALVVDEFPYLCETNKAVSSVFQKARRDGRYPACVPKRVPFPSVWPYQWLRRGGIAPFSIFLLRASPS